MAFPTFVNVSATPGDSIGTSTPSIPVNTTVNDIMVLFVSTANQAVALPSGWSNAPNNVLFTGTAGTAGAIRITVFWKRFVAGDVAPTIADVGDYHYAVIASYRGCISHGDPWDGGDGNTGTGTTVTVFNFTINRHETMLVHGCAGDADVATARVSAQTNADLANITERFDLGTALGVGGGMAIWDGTKATSGLVGNSTATIVSQAWAAWWGALRPEQPYPRPTQQRQLLAH